MSTRPPIVEMARALGDTTSNVRKRLINMRDLRENPQHFRKKKESEIFPHHLHLQVEGKKDRFEPFF